MKEKQRLRMRSVIAESRGGMVSGFEAFLAAGYGASAGRMEYVAGHLRATRHTARLKRAEFLAERQRFYSMKHLLRRDGLIERHPVERSILRLTKKGKSALIRLQKKLQDNLPECDYPALACGSARWTIVAFDIREREREKRSWMRKALKRLGFTMAQQSVWLSKRKLPRQFLDDIKVLGLGSSVEIFEATKAGSLDDGI